MKYTKNQIKTLRSAARIIEQGIKEERDTYTCPGEVTDYLTHQMLGLENEQFSVLFLTTRNQWIAFETLFHGTIDGTMVHPRVVVKRALDHNASALVIAHNHPSGDPEPSQADIRLTDQIKKACGLMEIRLLDHIIVGSNGTISFTETGRL